MYYIVSCSRATYYTFVVVAEPVKGGRSARGSSVDPAELKRLEAALSAKSSEAEEAKRQALQARSEAQHAEKGLQAFSILVQYLTTEVSHTTIKV